ncbi:TolC family protein [Spirosoma oryzicola]|uniref:TolC family protein n=1 Tax=Spirosoma oryzicola TaxID=2898794 RepID=UPI001E633F8F|nr:TolC family protein [Spirosoma oryzicola]UHG89546.1 TolC family protein [Spirosoma oryzicola]
MIYPHFLESHQQRSTSTKYRRTTGWLLWLSAGLLTTQAVAQQPTLNQVLDQSVRQYPFLKSKQAEVSSAERRLQASRTDLLPIVMLQDQYNYATSNSLNNSFFPNEGTNISTSGGVRPFALSQASFGSYTSASIEWRAIAFGRVKAGINVAKADLQRSQADYENELFQHQVRTIDAYLLLLINQKLVQIQRSNLDRAQTFKRVVDSGVRSGMRAGVDSALATAESVRARLLLLESQQREQVQRLRLSELAGQLQSGMQVDSMGFYSSIPNGVFLSDSLSPKNPTLRLFQSQINLSAARSLATQRSGMPLISLVGAGNARGSGFSNQGDVFLNNQINGLGYQVGNYLVGVVARWNLTNLLRAHQDYRADQFQIERSRQLFNTQRLQISRQYQEAETQYQVALEQARQAPIQLRAARQAYNQAKSRYESGLTDLPTLLQSVLTLNRAEVDGYVSISNVWRYLLLKAAAEGDLSLFMNQVN